MGKRLFAVFVLGCWAVLSQAQTYPAKPIRMVIDTAPGGITDILGRLSADWLTQQLGLQIVWVWCQPRVGGVVNTVWHHGCPWAQMPLPLEKGGRVHYHLVRAPNQLKFLIVKGGLYFREGVFIVDVVTDKMPSADHEGGSELRPPEVQHGSVTSLGGKEALCASESQTQRQTGQAFGAVKLR